MAHYNVDVAEDGSVQRILRDGEQAVDIRLEQHFSIARIYFRLAAMNLHQLEGASESEDRRGYGLQSFLMGLTGLEAFTNTYFHQRAQELGSDAILGRLRQTHGSLTMKLRDLVDLTGDGPLRDQEALITRVHGLAQLRNDVVHPRWEPSSLLLAGAAPVLIEGMVENPHVLFEQTQFCREALFWCLLVVARIAEARGQPDVRGHMFHWTGQYDLTLEQIVGELGL